jgi:hypothetical protein
MMRQKRPVMPVLKDQEHTISTGERQFVRTKRHNKAKAILQISE